MTSMSASEARASLYPLIEQVNDDAVAIHITSRKGNAVLISEDEYNSLRETLYLMRSPANAARLAQGIAQLESGDVMEIDMERLAKELE
ncbi:type II toxin-antitoxin system Phd/YefM family antitoxin [Nocardia asteroides]|uniref:Antitoxin n=1 Tax=Nocardia asteroides NBRC 15531 TaxID=1110697 RepID=U5EBZ4_NOCAS|nr:type II toxin-antitoxin system Phd/YefM family antitoxin [Nocardia asteroides]TLF69854.1 type II toxin-antitoxin system Phd/YefM family antitoxin [Nocardia asteroides NBRC 15531]UGT49359.1 type II toxin-antitoxin system Phd/YefM family antitoxin [Nocardia asteroides]SFL87742.1 antitoxin YefM [Nocardia asteroides]VEG38176.1 Antitoxin YefM [Nocardia asteroides]GAD83951.1 putative toxin-antitoxin system antitoxin component [Nocardia asteroides NBRC 15531]